MKTELEISAHLIRQENMQKKLSLVAINCTGNEMSEPDDLQSIILWAFHIIRMGVMFKDILTTLLKLYCDAPLMISVCNLMLLF